jgi:hypothetical protein
MLQVVWIHIGDAADRYLSITDSINMLRSLNLRTMQTILELRYRS